MGALTRYEYLPDVYEKFIITLYPSIAETMGR